MSVLKRLVWLVSEMAGRRRQRWVEISIDRACSHDLPPRLFDL